MPWRSHAMPAPAVLEARCCVGAAAQRMLARRPRRALAKASDCASIEVLNLAATSSEFHWQFKSDEAPARHSHALGEEEARWERMLQVRAGALSLLAPAPRRLHVMLAMSMPMVAFRGLHTTVVGGWKTRKTCERRFREIVR